jgi:transcriptional regulator with XRE-family HTH domain
MARTAREPNLAYRQALGTELRKARHRAKLSQEALANAADISPRYLRGIEHGQWNPTVEQIVRLGLVLGQQPGALLPRVDLDTGRPIT